MFEAPRHPYTRALLGAAPVPDPGSEAARTHRPLSGEIPDPADPPSGCRFRTRCPHAAELCAREVPALERAWSGHVACHFHAALAGDGTS